MSRSKKFLLLFAMLPSVAFGGSSGATSGGLPGADQVTESMLKVVNACTDEYVLTCETTTGDFEWQALPSSIGGSTGSADNAILRSNGTGGATLQDSSLFLSDGTSPQISFGGLTSAFPSIRRNGGDTDAIDVALADGSGFARIYAGEFWAGGSGVGMSSGSVAFFLASNGGVAWNSGGSASSSGNDLFLRRDAAGRLFVASDSSITLPATIISAEWIEANTAGSGAPNVLAPAESGKTLTNEGVTAANYHTLPSAVAGYQFGFCVQDADGIRIVANTGDTIRVIDKVTASAGYIESTTIGSCWSGVAINATEWFTTSITGTFTDGTFTYDDTGLTTP